MKEYDSSKIIVISYAGGAFGNFLYHVLTEHADGTYKVDNSNFAFDEMGSSHKTKTYTPTWYMEPTNYKIQLPDTDKSCLIECDNGLERDRYDSIRRVFGNCKIVRVCIGESVRPVYWNTCGYKSYNNRSGTPDAMMEDHVKQNWPDADADWAKRENYTLHYHNWSYGWAPVDDPMIHNVDFEGLMLSPVDTLVNLIKSLGFEVVALDKLKTLCNQWQISNGKYFKIYFDWLEIERSLDTGTSLNLESITSLNDQGYINYCIEKKYNVIIPVYDYRDWFKSTNQIVSMLQILKNDPNS